MNGTDKSKSCNASGTELSCSVSRPSVITTALPTDVNDPLTMHEKQQLYELGRQEKLDDIVVTINKLSQQIKAFTVFEKEKALQDFDQENC